MLKMSADELEELVEAAHKFRGRQVEIVESVSRNRGDLGHDRHIATRSRLTFKVGDVLTFFSGLQLFFGGANASYGISLESVARFSTCSADALEITEHFEQKTERRTSITVLESNSLQSK